jgi:predicted kinase
MTSSLQLVVFSGLPGTGKSTLAYAVSSELKFPVFSVDPIESAIIQSGISRSFETGYAAYLVSERMADEQLQNGIPTIIDAVSSVQVAKDMWVNLAKSHNAQLIVIECVLDEVLHRSRLEKRVRNIYGFSEVTWEQVLKTKTEYVGWSIPHLTVDTSNVNEVNLHKVLDYIRSFA